ncbi:hypothetical protein ACLB1E_31270 [Escherichia coli]
MPDATLARLIMPTGLNRRSDNALAPHPTPCSVPDATLTRLITPTGLNVVGRIKRSRRILDTLR